MNLCFNNIQKETFTGNKVKILDNFAEIIFQNQSENKKKNISTEIGQHLSNFFQKKRAAIIIRIPRQSPRVNAINEEDNSKENHSDSEVEYNVNFSRASNATTSKRKILKNNSSEIELNLRNFSQKTGPMPFMGRMMMTITVVVRLRTMPISDGK